MDPKYSQASPSKNSSNNLPSSKKITGEWIDPRTSQQRSATNQWVDPKNAPKPTGEWISPKSIYATSSVTGEKPDFSHAINQNTEGNNDNINRQGESSLNIDPNHVQHPSFNVIAQPQYTIIEPALGQALALNYQQPGTLIIPNFFNPDNIHNLPGNASKITYIDQHGHPIQTYSQNGHLDGDAGNGATYTATY